MGWLDGVGDVDWENLLHAYGPAADVPRLLEALDDPARFERTADALYGNVFHQGTRYEVTPFVVPFLAARLRQGVEDSTLAAFLLSYLGHLALGYPEDLFPRVVRPDAWELELDDAGALELRRRIANLPWAEREVDMARLDRHWAAASYFAVEKHVEAALPYLNATHLEVRDEACALLAWFPRRVADTREALEAAFDARGEGSVLLALARLGVDVTSRIPRGLANETHEERALAACAAALANPPAVDEAVVAELTAPLGDAGTTYSPFAGSIASTVGAALESLPKEHRAAVAEALARAHVDASAITTLQLTRQLFVCLFDGPAPASAAELDEVARSALTVVADHGGWSMSKDDDTVFANYASLVGSFGLPSRRAAFRAWLDGVATPSAQRDS